MKKFIYGMSLVLFGMAVQASIVSLIMAFDIVKISSGSQALASIIFLALSIILGGVLLVIERR